mmetsp:Transcript_22970/g.47743  ORF Transcript_22970/g.47743 Transcript_22970/m.47743 type:complete len:365 (+) Transcript_22970:55-1149(+)
MRNPFKSTSLIGLTIWCNSQSRTIDAFISPPRYTVLQAARENITRKISIDTKLSPTQAEANYQPFSGDDILEYETNNQRKKPQFPGSTPISVPHDLKTFIHQTNQSSPTNALLGKPSTCQCRHGYPQAYSLDPIPPTQFFKKRKIDRLNSGLLKLTCPLLVMSVDSLEDDGFMRELNAILQADGDEGNEWRKFMDDAHIIHAKTRQTLIAEGDEEITLKNLKSKLGERGANSFMEAGVAGARPMALNPDAKCLHAWLADYLFRNEFCGEDKCNENESMIGSHMIGKAILSALSQRGVDISGTVSCHLVCEGKQSTAENGLSDADSSIMVSVPIPRNKQRKRRDKEAERKRRRRMKADSEKLNIC